MRKLPAWVLLSLVILVGASVASRAEEGAAAPPGTAPAAPTAPAITGPRAGDKAPGFSLKTVDSGQARALESFTKAKGVKGAVVLFLSCRCPYVAQARAPLADLYKQYGSKVSFVGLNANQ